MKRLPLLLLLLVPMACGIVRAQNFDLTSGRVAVASLNGLWRFHTGDDMAWADPKFDDSQWALLHSDRDWSVQGYKGYGGMAWYRFSVAVPAGLDKVALYLPRLMTCYEVYADGNLIGTYGKMPPNASGYTGGDAYHLYALPSTSHGQRKIEIALRVWHWPVWAMYYGGGPKAGGGLVGDSGPISEIDYLSRIASHWELTSNQTLALLQTLAGLGALALFALRRKEREYLWFSLMMLCSATVGWVAVLQTSVIWNVELRDIIRSEASAGASLSLIAFTLALLQPRRTFLLKVAIASVALEALFALNWLLPVALTGVGFTNLLLLLISLPVYAWLVTVVVVRARQGSIDARLLVAPAMLSTASVVLTRALWITYIFGLQNVISYQIILTSSPFPIDLLQVTDALFLLALFAILILRFTRTRSAEERFASEVLAAQKVQQYLIPEHLPRTPGLAIESEYRPAREVGGDFFQVLPDAADSSVLIVVGDVAGHGMEAGMLATLIVGAIRTAASFTTDPEKIIGLLNERMCGRGLATCLALRIERDGSAVLANAGHLPPYLNGEELAMEGALPLGTIAGISFPILRFKLNEDDKLMLMTDGIVEAQDADGKLFGFDRIGEMLRKGLGGAALATAAQDFGQEDDITVLTVARMGSIA
jgi:hypothetical protein